MIPTHIPKTGYSRILQVADLPKNRPYDFALSLSADELTAVADDLDILSVKKLRFEGSLEFNDQGELVLSADLGVTVEQACVVSLEPVKTRIDTDVRRRFIEDMSALDEEHQMLPEDDENTDPLTEIVDLGMVMLEAIALNLPAFPRKDGVELKQRTFAGPGVTPMSDEETKPFAGLAALKDKLSSGD